MTYFILLLGDIHPNGNTEIDHWMSYAMILKIKNKKLLNYLNETLITRTWLACKQFTLADIHMFCTLYRQKYLDLYEQSYCNITRWYKHMSSLPPVVNAIARISENALLKQLDLQKEKSTVKHTNIRKQEGKFIDLPEAEMGKVKLYSTMKHIKLIFKLL